MTNVRQAVVASILVWALCFGCAGDEERGTGGRSEPDASTASCDAHCDASVPPGDEDAGGEGDAAAADAAVPSGCGDGRIEPGERCDDGNGASGDGCAARCDAIEDGFACVMPGEACESTVVCGDGRVVGNETCDDGGDPPVRHDGCSDECRIENGWRCPVPGVPCEAAACGDGILAGREECDDDDVTPSDGDGCSANCRLEPGFTCDAPGIECRMTVCNDGVPEGSEPCDDGNQVVGDGCNPFCEVEPDCSAGACVSACGDGLLLPSDAEACDDGNTRTGDGCSAGCEVEDGWACTLESGAPPDVLAVPVTYRDVVSLPTGGSVQHPDFETFGGSNATTGLVLADIGTDGKPVYADNCDANGGGTCPYGQQLTTQANFDQWYRDTPGVNVTVVERISLQRQPNGSYYFPDPSFYPFDTRGWVGQGLELTSTANVGGQHNFGFTSEVRWWFEYKGGEQLDFSGDDDVWVFVGGKLVVDLGGLHPQVAGSVTLDAGVAASVGLVVGNIYEMALFHAERHTNASNFNLTLAGFDAPKTTCTTVCGDGKVAGDEQCDDGVNDGSYGTCETDCTRAPFCGDGVRQKQHEACDDGVNLTPYGPDGCAPGCKRPGSCGDAKVQSLFGEECDDGDNTGFYGACAPGCVLGPRCGDGEVQQAEGETCDDGNTVSADGCSETCVLEGPG